MARSADWFFDFISPYAYLQFARLAELPNDVTLTLRPVLFAGLLEHWGQLGPAEIPLKRVHTAMVTRWRAEARGLPFRAPPRHPFNPLVLLRFHLALGATPAAAGVIFDHVWAEGQDGEEPESLARLAKKLGVADLAAVVGDPAVKAQLRANGEAAIAAGVYGVPSLAIEGRVFWGDDMFDLALAWLAGRDGGVVEETVAQSERPAASERPRRHARQEKPSAGWAIHHVNLPATDVRASAEFYTEVLGMVEAPWTFPPPEEVGHISADPSDLTLLPCATGARGANSGLHLIKPEAAFARKNGFDHNPTIGGHVAIQVQDLDAVMERLSAAGIPFTYAKPFAIPGMRHVYVYDPAMNLLEINEMVKER
ncbi:MAG: DsbA family protein [Pseudomonadota bacterium]